MQVDWFHSLVGCNADTIVWWQMVIRGILIFFYALVLVRLGGKRVFGKNTSFDIVLGVILGSILSRAITANARFIPTIAVATALMLLHFLMAKISFHSRTFGHMVKGTERKLVEDGAILWDEMAKSSITQHDLMEAIRSSGSVMEVEKVGAAFLERNGNISIVKKT